MKDEEKTDLNETVRQWVEICLLQLEEKRKLKNSVSAERKPEEKTIQ